MKLFTALGLATVALILGYFIGMIQGAASANNEKQDQINEDLFGNNVNGSN